MLKKRLVHTLLAADGVIQLSRNFALQPVGQLAWFRKYHSFDAMAGSVDELVILDVRRARTGSLAEHAEFVVALSAQCFMPLAVGGASR